MLIDVLVYLLCLSFVVVFQKKYRALVYHITLYADDDDDEGNDIKGHHDDPSLANSASRLI